MSDGKLQARPLGKVLCAFLIGSLFSGIFFAWCVTRPALQGLWFRTEEFWIFPTGKLWLLASGLFLLNLAGPYVVAHLNKWLSFSVSRLIIATLLIALIPASVRLIEPLPAVTQLLLFRFTVALVLSLMLFVITQRWYNSLAVTMLVVSLTASLIAGIPYAFLRSLPPEWFEALRFFLSSSLLALLFGYWLVKSSRSENAHVKMSP